MDIIKCFDISVNMNELISIVGGGGKTTTMFHLARRLKHLNKKVLVTTTTAIYVPKADDYDNLVILDENIVHSRYLDNTITVMGSRISSENKLLGVSKEYIDDLFKTSLFDYILVEADGSKGRPIKAPASHEPVIPSCTTKTIGVIGMDSLDKKANEDYVHRPELFVNVTESHVGDIIDEEVISRLIISENGLFKGVPSTSKKYLFLNKAESEKDMQSAYRIKKLIYESGYKIDGFIAGSMKNLKIIIS